MKEKTTTNSTSRRSIAETRDEGRKTERAIEWRYLSMWQLLQCGMKDAGGGELRLVCGGNPG